MTTECSYCGTELASYENRCPTCGKTTAHYHRQRRCLHCGTPAAEQAQTCLMCHKPVDSFPLDRSIFSGSWTGIGLGVLIIVGLVVGVSRYQGDRPAQAVAAVTPATPTLTPTITRTPTPSATPAPPTATATRTPIPTATPRTHIVAGGDTLLFIAQQYGVDLADLTRFNGISQDMVLSVGQTIRVPPSTAEPAQLGAEQPLYRVYVIESGDTLSSIAFEYGTTVAAIEAANPDLNLDLIFPGQELVVPLSTPTPTSTPTPSPTATPTPGPPFPPPVLLTPADGQVVDADPLLFQWTATGLLADDEFYVVQLGWPTGEQTEHWVKTSSLRLSKEERPANGWIEWRVAVMRRADTGSQKTVLTPPGETHRFEWR